MNRGLLLITVSLVAACGQDGDPRADVLDRVDVFTLAPLDDVRAIRDLARTKSGSVWILNSGEPFLILQRVSGENATAFGEAGDGPDEIGFAAAIVGATDSMVTIVDRERREVRSFRSDGRNVSNRSIEELESMVAADLGETLSGSPFSAALLDSHLVTIDYPEPRAPGTAHLWNRRLVSIDLEDGEVNEIIDFRVPRDRVLDRMSGAAILAPAPLWAVCADGSIVYYLPFESSLTWSDTRGTRVGVPKSVRPLRDEEVEAHLLGGLARRPRSKDMTQDELVAMLPMVLERLGDEVSALAPAYVEMGCDPQNRIWLQTFSVQHDWMGRGSTIDVMDRQGVVATDIPLPAGFHPLRFYGDTILGVLRDQFDVGRVAGVVIECALRQETARC
ncbi:MAG: hypothetical protein ACRELV_08830 [Longimicrobiales bacterium]